NHERCTPPPTDFVPSRLIEIPTSAGASTVKIVETRGHYKPWCALSYCWGGPQLIRTTASNFRTGQRFLELSAIPETILDALTTTKALGVSYLWVDSLCIIQDDPDDLTRELASMPKIYKHATLTISAALAQTCNEGFLHPRSPRIVPLYGPPVRLRCIDEQDAEGTIVLHGTRPPQEHIHTRGWTLQEHLLSPRLLIYSTSSLAWQCRSRKYTDVPLSAPIHDAGLNEFFSSFAKQFYAVEITEEDAIVAWLRIIEVYSGRHLGFPTDILLALSAIAEEFGTRMQWTYVAGLWQEHIQYMLCWECATTKTCRRPSKYRAPSWSWASID
ncbi:HET-domain-containing protein, partial [Ophiobolus disseminans]